MAVLRSTAILAARSPVRDSKTRRLPRLAARSATSHPRPKPNIIRRNRPHHLARRQIDRVENRVVHVRHRLCEPLRLVFSPHSDLGVSARQSTVPAAQMVHYRRRIRREHLLIHVDSLVNELVGRVEIPVNRAGRSVDFDRQKIIVKKRRFRRVQVAKHAFLHLQQRTSVVVGGSVRVRAGQAARNARRGQLRDERD